MSYQLPVLTSEDRGEIQKWSLLDYLAAILFGVSGTGVSQGGLQAVPAGSTNGTVLPNRPTKTDGVRFEVGGGSSITFTIATAQPGSAPAITKTIATEGTHDEPLAPGDSIYVTMKSGTVNFRWVQR